MKLFYPALLLMLLPGVVMSQSTSTPPAAAPPQAMPEAPPPQQPAEPPLDGDPLLAPPPLPEGKVTLIGGTVVGLDRIRYRMTIEPFGGGEKMKFVFDERTRIFRDGVETTVLGINKGERVYVDSQLDGDKVFARTIRVVTKSGPADASGQVLEFDQKRGRIVMRDRLSAQPVRFVLADDTRIVRDTEQSGSRADLKRGALIAVQFSPEKGRGIAREVRVLAVPGEQFRFAGRITHFDLRMSQMAVENETDQKTYDLGFDTARVIGREDLAIGTTVDVVATFTGEKYVAREINVRHAAAAAQPQPEQEEPTRDDE